MTQNVRRRVSWRDRIRPRRDEVLGLAVVAVSLVGSLVLSRLAAEHSTHRILSFDAWLACGAEMYQHLHVYFHHRWFSATEITALVGLLTLMLPAGRRAARISLPMVAGLLLVAAVVYALMSSMEHVRLNHSARYVILSVLVWQTALVGFGVVQLGAVLPVRRWTRGVPLALVVAMTLVAAARHGWPSKQVVRQGVDRAMGRHTDDILAAGCTHVTSDYWHVWPAVFHANLRLADQRVRRTVWGLAHRAGATEQKWTQVQWRSVRIAEIVGDEPQTARNLRHYRILRVVEHARVRSIRTLALAADWNRAAERLR